MGFSLAGIPSVHFQKFSIWLGYAKPYGLLPGGKIFIAVEPATGENIKENSKIEKIDTSNKQPTIFINPDYSQYSNTKRLCLTSFLLIRSVVSNQKKSFSQRKFSIIMIALVVSLIIDISVVKINDLIDKYFIPIQVKLVLFSINSSSCLLLQFFLIRYIQGSFEGDRIHKTLKARVIHTISSISLIILAALIGFLIFQQFYNSYYSMSISIAIIAISYGIAACLLVWLAMLFFSWFRSSHNVIVLLYFISIAVIAFNLIITAFYASVKLSDVPHIIGEYVGSSGDLTGGIHSLLTNVYSISTFISFFSMWIATAILMNYYRDKLINVIVYWVILAIPLGYFLITYFYQISLGRILISIVQNDPVTISIVLGAFLALSKPIGGLLFGIVFWNISRIIGYERKIKTYMIISGWGVLLIFSSNQAATQIVLPYPPFGLATTTILTTAAYLMLLGIYNSATLVSANNEVRRSIQKHALESKLLGAIGQAEMEKEIQKTVRQVTQDKYDLEKELEEPVELDEKELEKYIEFVVREVRKASKH